jgi:hypothetical protein
MRRHVCYQASDGGFSSLDRSGMAPFHVSALCHVFSRAAGRRTSILVRHDHHGSSEVETTWRRVIMAIGTGPCRIDSPTSWHIALAGERNLASEIGFSSSILLHAHLLLTPEAESDQIVHDSKLSLEDLLFLRYASVHKQHCEEPDETDSIQTYDTTTDPNVESVCDL